MNFELSQENIMVRDAIRNWVSKECPADVVSELDEAGTFPKKLFKKLSKLGFSGMIIPEEFDGEGRNFLGASIVVEEIAYAYPALAGCFAASAFFGGAVFSELADEKQKGNYLPGCAQGEILVSLAAEEVADDPQVELIEAMASLGNDDYVLNGKKQAVWLADQASLFLFLAKTGEGDDELTFFCVDAKAKGITLEPIDTLGRKGASICDVLFTDVRVSKDLVLGGADQVGDGKNQLKRIQDIGLLYVTAAALGLARGAFDYSLKHARQREQFGQVIGRFPAISAKFAENSYKIEAARLITYQAAWLADEGKPIHKEVAMAKCFAEGAAIAASMDGLQITGGYGYTMEYDIQRYVRDAVALFSEGVSKASLKERLGDGLGLAV